jgi:hypothetical protein
MYRIEIKHFENGITDISGRKSKESLEAVMRQKGE